MKFWFICSWPQLLLWALHQALYRGAMGSQQRALQGCSVQQCPGAGKPQLSREQTWAGLQKGQGKLAAAFKKMRPQSHCHWMENWTQGQVLLLFVAVLQQVLNCHKARPDYKAAYNWDPTRVSNKLSDFSMNSQFKGNVAFCYWIPDIGEQQRNSKNLRTSILVGALDVNAIT